MNNFLKSVAVILFLLLFYLAACSPQNPQPEKKAVFILVDGISADILESVETPNLDSIISSGSYSRAYVGGEIGGYSESPTVSAVGYNHLLTGTWSNKHNVYDNDIESPNYNYWNIFRLFKYQYPEKQVAIFSSWTDNRTKLIGEGLTQAGSLVMDIAFDGLELDSLTYPQEDGYIQKIDDEISKQAAESLLNDGPDLSWVYLWYPDDTGHNFGETAEHFESIRVADRQIGRIWDAVQEREKNYNEDWLIIVTTDHGRRLPDGKDHGGQSDRERMTWVATNEENVNTYFKQSTPAIVDIYPTLARHLNVKIAANLERELDGVPLSGELSISNASATFNPLDPTVLLNWKSWHDDGNIRIWAATTNEFSNGGEDDYVLMDEVPVSSEQATIDVSSQPSDFYKIVLEAPHNTLNRWIIQKN